MRKMTRDEKKKFVVDYISGMIFTSCELPRMDLLFRAFMPLLFLQELDYEDIGCVYEYKSEEIVKLIGVPVFASCRLICKEDWNDIIEMLEKVKTATLKALES